MKKRKFAKINTDKIETARRIKCLEERCASRDRMIKRLFVRLREKREQIDSLAYIIGYVANSLPTNRDWLDHDIEKAMLNIVKRQPSQPASISALPYIVGSTHEKASLRQLESAIPATTLRLQV